MKQRNIPPRDSQTRKRCPNDGESYQPDTLMSAGVRTSDEHRIETSQNVIVDDGDVALRIEASCPCGWRDTEVLK